MDLGLRDRGVLVTGAAGLIGAATARAFASEGARVAIHHRDERDAEAAWALAHDIGGTIVTGALELPDVAETVIVAALRGLGRLDVCIANAGRFVAPTTPVWELQADRWHATFTDNLTTSYLTTRSYMRHAASTGRGSLVLVGSAAGTFGLCGAADYAAAKGAVMGGFLQSVALDAAGLENVRVNAVAPGWIEQSGTSIDVTALSAALAVQCAPRLGRPQDVASTIVWLASSAARHLTGAVIEVDGGLTGRLVRTVAGTQ